MLKPEVPIRVKNTNIIMNSNQKLNFLEYNIFSQLIYNLTTLSFNLPIQVKNIRKKR